MLPTLRRFALLPAALFLASACSSVETPYQTPDESLGSTAAAITAADVLSRAEEWVAVKLHYCQAPNHKPDYDSACASVCNRHDNAAWDPYRSDCSGLVSWAWGLPAPGRVTGQFAPFNNDISHTVPAASLEPGDAVNNSEHIMLFKAWKTPGKEATFIEEPGCSSSTPYAHEFTSSVTIDTGANTIHVSWNGMTFHPIRFDSISQQAPDFAAQYVKQSWPLASQAPIQLVVGDKKTGSIDLKNVGSKTWKAGVVKLAPIPRDKASNLAAGSWISKTRVSSVTKDVAPGAVGHFEWDLEGSVKGDFKPYFGLVADGVTWFAQSGGPPDNELQINVHVSPAPVPPGMGGAPGAGGTSSAGGEPGAGGESATGGHAAGGGEPAAGGASGGSGAHTGGQAGTSSHAGGEAGAPTGTAGTGGSSTGSAGHADASAGSPGATGAGGASTGDTGGGQASDVPATTIDDAADSGSGGGCSTSGRAGDGAFAPFGLLAAALVMARRRRAVSPISQ